MKKVSLHICNITVNVTQLLICLECAIIYCSIIHIPFIYSIHNEKVYHHVFNVCHRKHLLNAMELVYHSNSLLCIVCLLVAKVQRGPWQVFRAVFAVGWAIAPELAGLWSLSLDFSGTYSGQRHLVHVCGGVGESLFKSQCVCFNLFSFKALHYKQNFCFHALANFEAILFP